MDIVIFDTNAYRNLVVSMDAGDIEAEVKKFRRIEEKAPISAQMHPIVIKELLYHVAGERDKLHYTCVNALNAMYFHCGDAKEFKVVAGFDLQLSNFLFGTVDSDREKIDLQLGEIVASLALKGVDYTLQKYQFNLKQIRAYVKETEDFFKEQLKKFIKKIDPEAESWSILQDDKKKRAEALEYFKSQEIEDEIAAAYITLIHDNLVKRGLITAMSDVQLKERIQIFKEAYQAGIGLYKEVLQKFVQPDFNMDAKSRENFVWDIHLMFIVGNHRESVTGSSLFLVTSDKEMRNAAKKNGFDLKVFSFPEYLEVITGRIDGFEE